MWPHIAICGGGGRTVDSVLVGLPAPSHTGVVGFPVSLSLIPMKPQRGYFSDPIREVSNRTFAQKRPEIPRIRRIPRIPGGQTRRVPTNPEGRIPV